MGVFSLVSWFLALERAKKLALGLFCVSIKIHLISLQAVWRGEVGFSELPQKIIAYRTNEASDHKMVELRPQVIFDFKGGHCYDISWLEAD